MLPSQRPPEEKKSSGFFTKLMKKVDACDIELTFKNKTPEDMVPVEDRHDFTTQRMYVFLGDEPVEGVLELKPKGKLTHLGILIEFIGVITVTGNKEEKTQFLRAEKKFQADGGTISGPTPLPFNFDLDKEHDSYRGINARVHYFLRLKIRRSVVDVNFKEEIWVSRLEEQYQSLKDRSEDKVYNRETNFSKGVGMEVGVDDKLHIEFKYDKKTFHIRERIVGQVGFKVAKLDLHCGEVSLVRREFIGVGSNQFFETETLQKFEIMDGLPVPGEVVPIRLYLNSVPRLTPSYVNVNKIFSVKYFVNLVLVTGDGKRYFKQQEIAIYRRKGQEAPTPMVINVDNLQR
ncbi:Vacuolar protein sorting-associated protein 26 [Diplonema papillatum]|nr:Vacuolar protein sorting-associated protein 26 [Diplonema papillatum]